MKPVIAWALAVLSVASAIELAPRSSNPRVVGLDIGRRTVSNIVAHDNARRARLAKRQRTVEETLDNEDSLYFANLTLGTPPQQLRLHLDTGSSDLWVNVANSTFCASADDPCFGGTYNPAGSSTRRFVNSDFNISYVDGSSATGDYVSDTLGFGGMQLQNFQFGVGEESSSGQGVLGIGYVSNEVQVQNANDPSYPNLPQALRNAGYTNRNAYSLWLNDLDANTGQILFGGVNKAKYQGNLETVPIFRQSGQYYQFIIAMSSFGFNGSTVTSANLPAPVLLDSGSTLSRLPDDIVATIYDQLDVAYDNGEGVGLAYCDYRNTNAYLEFGFSGINIQVPFNELFLDVEDNNGGPLTFKNGKQACLFGIAPSDGIIPILGDTFLRSAYVVYDLELNEISLAQTVFNATADDVVEIASGSAAVPGATPAATTISRLASQTATSAARLGAPTGSFTAVNAAPSSASTLLSTGTVTAGATSSRNMAYPTQVPYLAGAAIMAGAGLLL